MTREDKNKFLYIGIGAAVMLGICLIIGVLDLYGYLDLALDYVNVPK